MTAEIELADETREFSAEGRLHKRLVQNSKPKFFTAKSCQGKVAYKGPCEALIMLHCIAWIHGKLQATNRCNANICQH